eukprot:CAMPEP_0185040600 /NCGR_PEP_ID=MMETSP1103-20130426/38837_1 /TAXON_ID=36769 /ORGANISM="Paraphysomonas bandaiensis, Strain Caron Lab Isolate" /LENGTH=366 /DNA_ID=CAMNT_0027579967 /DNA_START=144 /DNA_END=1247 /DNA_ORIENTATION=-
MNGKLFVPTFSYGPYNQQESNECEEDIALDSMRQTGCTFLTVQPCFNTKLCQAFPSASHEQRLSLRLDPEASYSITDEVAADAVSTACLDLLSVVFSDVGTGDRVAVDCTAGAGGNVASLIRSGAYTKVIAFEINTSRARDLDHNMSVLFPRVSEGGCKWEVLPHNAVPILVGQNSGLFDCIDTLVIDPPWGGLNYRLNTDSSSPPRDYSIGDERNSISISDLLSYECTRGSLAGRVKLAALKVPSEFDASAFCSIITADGPWEKETPSGEILSPDSSHTASERLLDSRPHPFRLQLGARTAVLLIAYPPFFRNTHLDSLVRNLLQFDKARGAEFHPRFFDWERQRWISLRSWKGCNMEVSVRNPA